MIKIKNIEGSLLNKGIAVANFEIDFESGIAKTAIDIGKPQSSEDTSLETQKAMDILGKSIGELIQEHGYNPDEEPERIF